MILNPLSREIPVFNFWNRKRTFFDSPLPAQHSSSYDTSRLLFHTQYRSRGTNHIGALRLWLGELDVHFGATEE